jgi:hypothetical protein
MADIQTMNSTSSDFPIEAVKVGRSMMTGRTTAGHVATGVVLEVLPGIAFRVDTGAQISFLWGDLRLLSSEAVVDKVYDDAMDIDNADADADAPPPPTPVRRTDSAADYGANGFPDCEFWESRGIQPLFLATPADYNGDTRSTPQQMIQELNTYRKTAEILGPAHVRAWQRQMIEATEKTTKTPPRSPSPACPGAPKRRLTMTHRGVGILEGDFIKPDPVLTRSETRQYLLEETQRWMNGRIQLHALSIYAAQLTPADVEKDVGFGLWPAGRLFTLLMRLREMEAVPDTDIDQQIDHVARWVMHTIQGCLERSESDPLTDLEEYVMEFWRKDLLPNGSTIASYWDHSPFDGLRHAGPISVDDKIDTLLSDLLWGDHTFTLPGWALTTGVVCGVWYMGCVAAALSMKCH